MADSCRSQRVITAARSILARKCQHKDLETPRAPAFLIPLRLEEAKIYWTRDLARQVAPHPLPDWTMVTEELADLLTQFFAV